MFVVTTVNRLWHPPFMFTVRCCRYGIGRFTTAEEVYAAVAQTVSHVNKLREMSPLWEMVQEGIDIKTIQWSQH
jgi:hypothetical protein